MNAFGEKTSLGTIEVICSAWAVREPLSPAPLITLARAYDQAKSNTTKALALVQKAMELMFSGDARLAGDWSGYYLKGSLAEAYALEANLLLANKDLPGAYAAAKTAAGALRADDPRGDILEGNVWRAAGDLDRAEKTFAAALPKGTGDEARAALKEIYLIQHGGEEGFEDHIKAVAAGVKPKGNQSVATLPGKTIKTLDGKKIELAKLQGKIVVLNFFALWCAPCLAEIPTLNKLVDEFKGNAGVVFLASTDEDPKNLKAYVKSHPFRYQIIPADDTLIPAFKIEAWPTHVVIGRDGAVAARLAGASESIAQTLKKKIEEQR
jgi:thiol-disulfide isomerase/thioredoxin